MNRDELKIASLKEHIGKQESAHADREADLRIEITLLAQEVNDLRERLNETTAKAEAENASDSTD